MYPLLNCWMLGALISGTIAARAVTRLREAVRDFRRLNVGYYPLLAAHRLIQRVPSPARAWVSHRFLESFFRLPERLQRPVYFFVPGYGRMG